MMVIGVYSQGTERGVWVLWMLCDTCPGGRILISHFILFLGTWLKWETRWALLSEILIVHCPLKVESRIGLGLEEPNGLCCSFTWECSRKCWHTGSVLPAIIILKYPFLMNFTEWMYMLSVLCFGGHFLFNRITVSFKHYSRALSWALTQANLSVEVLDVLLLWRHTQTQRFIKDE